MLNTNFICASTSNVCTRCRAYKLQSWASLMRITTTFTFSLLHYGDALSHIFDNISGFLLIRMGNNRNLQKPLLIIYMRLIFFFYFNGRLRSLLFWHLWSWWRSTAHIESEKLAMCKPYRFFPSQIVITSSHQWLSRAKFWLFPKWTAPSTNRWFLQISPE